MKTIKLTNEQINHLHTLLGFDIDSPNGYVELSQSIIDVLNKTRTTTYGLSETNINWVKAGITNGLESAPKLMGWNCMTQKTFAILNHMQLRYIDTKKLTVEELNKDIKLIESINKAIKKYNKLVKS